LHIEKSLLAYPQDAFLGPIQICNELDHDRKCDGNGNDCERSAGSS